MKFSSEFKGTVSLLLTLIAVLLLAGCGVNKRQVLEAEKACAPHGGAWFHEVQILRNQFRVRCLDGTDIEGFIEGGKQ
jgi:uncharacterized lipoprotein YajG